MPICRHGPFLRHVVGSLDIYTRSFPSVVPTNKPVYSHFNQAIMLQSPNIRLDDYSISDHGFLPTGLPLRRLPSSYYAPWENLAVDLPRRIKTGQIRAQVDNLPVLTTICLRNEPEWRRAYVVLGLLTHAYIWGGEKPRDVSTRFPSSPRHMPTNTSLEARVQGLVDASFYSLPTSLVPVFLKAHRIPDPPAVHLEALPRDINAPRPPSLRHVRSPHAVELHRDSRSRHHQPGQPSYLGFAHRHQG